MSLYSFTSYKYAQNPNLCREIKEIDTRMKAGVDEGFGVKGIRSLYEDGSGIRYNG